MRPPPTVLLALLLAACPSAEPAPEEPTPAPDRWAEAAPWDLASPHPCPVAVDPDDDLVGELLAAVGLDRTIGIPESMYDAWGGHLADDPTRLAFFHELQESWADVPCHAGNMAARADASFDSGHRLAALVADGAAQLDVAVSAGGGWPALPDDAAGAFEHALGRLGADLDQAGVAAAAALPRALTDAAALVLYAAEDADDLRDEALAVMGDDAYHASYFRDGGNAILVSEGSALNPDWDGASSMYVGSDDASGRLFEGGVRLGQALDEADWAAAAAAVAALDPAGAGDFDVRVDTPLGLVVLRGAAADVYDPSADPDLAGRVLLVVDAGGDDEVRTPAGANTSEDHPVAIHVDLGGDDLYAYPEVPHALDEDGLLPADTAGRHSPDAYYGPYALSHLGRQGAGRLGYGMLADLGGGDDVYRSLRKSQGFASFGVGLLYDDGGDDSYTAENGAQGSATTGVALLVDGGGDDHYRAFAHAQGFAFVSSFAALYDHDGDDTYELPPTPVLFYSPQQPGVANSSLGQGTAFGWRRDGPGTHLGGGVALLRDRDGHDTYDGSVFVQGVSYWMGLGVLADRDGDDRYNGLFYAQGATAHFGVAAFLEGGGDDHYNADVDPVHSAIGLAHDFSVTVFVDDDGDDVYFGPDRSIGASKCHGLSVFVDNAGDDAYEAEHQRAIGWATDYDWAEDVCGDSDVTPSYGFFVDASGTDTYVKPDGAPGYGDGMLWLPDDPVDATALEYMGGLDADGGSTWVHAYGAAFDGR